MDTGHNGLGPGERPKLKKRYKHLMPEDRLIWEQVLTTQPDLFDWVWYDVLVGSALRLESGQPAWMDKFVEYSYRKRIDIVGRKNNTWYICEAKPRAGIVALGQIIAYTIMFLQEHAQGDQVRSMIFTDLMDEDVAPMLDFLGVDYVEVGRGLAFPLADKI